MNKQSDWMLISEDNPSFPEGTCLHCHGEGEILLYGTVDPAPWQLYHACPDCEGTGNIWLIPMFLQRYYQTKLELSDWMYFMEVN